MGADNSTRREPSAFEHVDAAVSKAEFEKKCEALCRSLELYLQTHTYTDIQRNAQSEVVTLIGFNQSMCSLMRKGKSCVKNPKTVEWLTKFLSK